MFFEVVIENNNSLNSSLESEHGLCIYIEEENTKILFDTGMSNKAIRNAHKLNIDLKSLDYIVLSHAHYDHCGGFNYFFNECGENTKVIVGNDFFNKADKYHVYEDGSEKYIGIDFEKKLVNERIIEVKNELTLNDNIKIFSNISNAEEKIFKGGEGLIRKEEEKILLDNFNEELVLLINSGEDISIFTGCAHNNILKIIEEIEKRSGIKVNNIIGGLHLKNSDDKKIIEIINGFKKFEIKKIIWCHCTGQNFSKLIKEDKSKYIQAITGYKCWL